MSNQKQILKDLRILNTRPVGQNKELSLQLRDFGATVIEWPVLSILPINFKLETLPEKNDFFIFTSQSAVQYFFSKKGIIQGQVIAIGYATKQALTLHGVENIIMPELSTSEGILALDCLRNIRGQSIVLVKGENGRTLLFDSLTERGAHVNELLVYRRIKTDWPTEVLNALWSEDAIDIIIYTSQEAIMHVFEQFQAQRNWLCAKPAIVLSGRLADVLKNLGVHKSIICDYDKIIEACLLLKGIIHE